MSELNAFYLKYLLWVPPAHWLNIARIALHALAGAVAVREMYQYFSDRKCKRLGAQAWLAIAVICIESLICVKFGRNEFSEPAPANVVLFWKVFGTFLVLFPIWQFWLRPRLLFRLAKPKAE